MMTDSEKPQGSRGLVVLVKPETARPDFVLAPPLGILYLAAALERAGYSVRLVHERFTPDLELKTSRAIIDEKPLFVGISSFTGPSLLPALRLSRTIKAHSDIPVVWGGLHATMLPEQLLAERAIDLALRGEGEESLVRLAELLAVNRLTPGELAGIPGLVYRENGKTRVNDLPPFIKNLDEFSPAWHLLDIERYLNEGRYIYTDLGSKLSHLRTATVMTSRGCPGRCGYCYNQFVNHRTFRGHSVDFTVNHIERLKKEHAVTAIAFEDDCLFTDRHRALAILSRIGLPWGASIRADYLARWGGDFIRRIKEFNCLELRIGAESGSQQTLDLMHKDIRRDHILRAAEMCLENDIKVMMGFMIGIPGEQPGEMLKTLDLMDELEKMGVAVTPGPSLFFPYPGTPLYHEAVKAGFKPPENTEKWAIPWGPAQPFPPYIPGLARYAGYYRSVAMGRNQGNTLFRLVSGLFRRLARWRWKKRFFHLPLDYHLPRLLRVFREKAAGWKKTPALK